MGLVAVPAHADPPTLDEIKAAVADGVEWLADQQEDDGYWDPDWESGVTALAIKKLMHHTTDARWGLGLDSPFDGPYADNIERGLNWMFANEAVIVGIGVQPAGDPDTDGDGLGVYFGLNHPTYTTGIMLMVLSEAVELDRVVEEGILTGSTYEDVARDMMDYLCWGQNDAGLERGGWGYTHNFVGFSDNSNSGYAALGLAFAETPQPWGAGLTIPQFVKDELNIWIDYIQNDVNGDANDGGSGYDHPDSWVNILKTGNLLAQMALVGDTAASARVQDALDYLERHWDDANQDPGWLGDAVSSSYQATFTVMKGMTSLGIHQFGAGPIDWQTDFETVLLAEQNADGSWPLTNWDFTDRILSTTWALLTLQKAAPPVIVPVDIKPTSCRNPLNVKSKGVLPVAILGTEDFDVTQIDPATVELEGVSPLRWALEDVATPWGPPYIGKSDCFDCNDLSGDGYLDLTLKFDMQAVVAAIGADVEDGDCLVLTLTGYLMADRGGAPIIGEDVVAMIKKGR